MKSHGTEFTKIENSSLGTVVDKTDRGYIITMGGSLGNDDMGFRLRIKGIAVQAPLAVSVNPNNE
jgi:hypothetical protein